MRVTMVLLMAVAWVVLLNVEAEARVLPKSDGGVADFERVAGEERNRRTPGDDEDAEKKDEDKKEGDDKKDGEDKKDGDDGEKKEGDDDGEKKKDEKKKDSKKKDKKEKVTTKKPCGGLICLGKK